MIKKNIANHNQTVDGQLIYSLSLTIGHWR